MARCKPEDTLSSCLEKLRRARRREERALIRELVAQWAPQRDWLQEQIAALREDIEARKAMGMEPMALLYRLERWQVLERELANRLERYGAYLEGRVVEAKREAVRDGFEEAAHALREVGAGQLLARVDFLAGFPEAEAALVSGLMADGAPLGQYFTQAVGPKALRVLREEILRGVAVGWGPGHTARRIANRVSSIPLARALMIARTETLRAMREASRMAFQEAGVRRWRRVAALDGRTCPVCWALHGKEYPISQTFQTHPNCRCTLVPVLDGMDFDIPDRDRAYLGLRYSQAWKLFESPRRAAAFRMGYVDWDDLVDWHDAGIFGATPALKPLRRLLNRHDLEDIELYLREGVAAIDWHFWERYLNMVAPMVGDTLAVDWKPKMGVFEIYDGPRPVTWSGRYWYRTGKIELNYHELAYRDPPQSWLLKTLVHEVLHAYSVGIHPSDDKPLEEGVVELLSHYVMRKRYPGLEYFRAYDNYTDALVRLEDYLPIQSVTGARAGESLARYLLPIPADLRPAAVLRWAVAANLGGLDMEMVQAELEELGYDVESLMQQLPNIPAPWEYELSEWDRWAKMRWRK